MKFKVKNVFIKAAKLKEGVYFAKEVEGVKLEIADAKAQDSLIPIMIKKEKKGDYYIVDIPDSIVDKIKHRDGSEIDLAPDGSIYIL